MRTKIAWVLAALTLVGTTNGAQSVVPRATAVQGAVGLVTQGQEYRARFGSTFKVSVLRQLAPKLHAVVAVTREEFDPRLDVIYAPCIPDQGCPTRPTSDLTLVSGSAELLWQFPSAPAIGISVLFGLQL